MRAERLRGTREGIDAVTGRTGTGRKRDPPARRPATIPGAGAVAAATPEVGNLRAARDPLVGKAAPRRFPDPPHPGAASRHGRARAAARGGQAGSRRPATGISGGSSIPARWRGSARGGADLGTAGSGACRTERPCRSPRSRPPTGWRASSGRRPCPAGEPRQADGVPPARREVMATGRRHGPRASGHPVRAGAPSTARHRSGPGRRPPASLADGPRSMPPSSGPPPTCHRPDATSAIAAQ